jgi:hypothetical protein
MAEGYPHNNIIKTLAVLQIVGSVILICVLEYYLFPRIIPSPFSNEAILWAPPLLGIYAGWNMWKGKKSGYITSTIVWGMQMIYIAGPVISYTFCLGGGIFIGALGPGRILLLQLTPYFYFYLRRSDIPFGIGVNLVALAVFMYLLNIVWEDEAQDDDVKPDLKPDVDPTS